MNDKQFEIPERYFRYALLFILSLGIVVRARYVFASAFPLNDGGLFYAMANDLRANGFALPAFTSYNGGDIPFAYPPLGFYAVNLLDALTPMSLIDAFRFLPLVLNILLLPAFYLLARNFLSSRFALLAAVAAYALLPRSFIWLLMGGGLTRSLGLLFALLALHFFWKTARQPDLRFAIAALLLASLTALSHIETAWFLGFSSLLLLLTSEQRARALTLGAFVWLGVFVLTSPWWITVLANHGLEPFLAAGGTGGSVFSDGGARIDALLAILRVNSSSEPLFPVITMLGLLGAVHSVVTGKLLLPLWWLAIILLDLRAYPTFTTVPLALLAGIGLAEVVLPAFARLRDGSTHAGPRLARAGLILPVLLLAYATLGASVRSDRVGGEVMSLESLSRAERSAMSWVANSADRNGRYLVIPVSSWETARTLEWFPVLANRVSVATVQGTEWLQSNGFERAVDAYHEAMQCGYETTQCLETWQSERGLSFNYVYVAKYGGGQCCSTLLDSLASDPRYALAYDGLGATIYARLQEAPPGDPATQAPGRDESRLP